MPKRVKAKYEGPLFKKKYMKDLATSDSLCKKK